MSLWFRTVHNVLADKKFLETCCLVTYRLLMMINLGQHAVKGFAGGLVTLAYYLIALGL